MKKDLSLGIFLLLTTSLFGQQTKKSLTIGDQVPDIKIDNLINYSGTLKKYSDLKGKAVILDFWATWCGSCVTAFPKLDSLQKKFDKDLLILPVTSQSEDLASNLLKSIQRIKHVKIPSVVEDTIWRKIFEYNLLPHYVWIDASGVVRAITDGDVITDGNIQSLIDGKALNLPTKKDRKIPYKGEVPLFAGGVVAIKDDLLYHSAMTKYRQDIVSLATVRNTYIVCTNFSIIGLYQIAFGNFSMEFLGGNRLLIEGAKTLLDSARLGIMGESTRKLRKEIGPENLYCYELVIDSSFSREQKLQIMQQDLNRFFGPMGINGRVEKRKVRIMALIRTSSVDKLSTTAANATDAYTMYSIRMTNLPISRFLSKLQAYFRRANQLSIKDETGYKGNIDIEINCDLSDLNAVNKELEKYDLKFIEKDEEIDMILITKI